MMTPEYPILSGPLHEARDLTAHLRGMAVEALPVLQGSFKGAVSSINLDDMTLEVVRSDPVLLLGKAAEGRSGFLLTLGELGETKWNGTSIGVGQVALFEDGCSIAVSSHNPLNCAIVSFTGSGAADLLPANGHRPWQDQPDPVMCIDQKVYSQLAAFADVAERFALPAEGVSSVVEVFRGQSASFQDEVRKLFSPSRRSVQQRRCRPLSRVQIVRQVDEYLRANPARPVYTDELCSALGVSASCLHGAFEATFQLSPHRYLKLRRMTMVRAMLLSGSDPWHSVKAAALSHGFWHLGQFAHDYRVLFGEAPSETLFRARNYG